MKLRRYLALLVIALIVGAYLHYAGSAWWGVPVTLVRIVDGDTIVATFRGKEEHVRIIGIDCPETRNTSKMAKQAAQYGLTITQTAAIGRQATERAQDALDGAERVRLVLPRAQVRRDQYRRLLSYVSVAGEDLGLMQIETGLADVYDRRHDRRERYERARDRAKGERLGIWSGETD